VDKSVDETRRIDANPLSTRAFYPLPQKAAVKKFNKINQIE
jgi:hypothetical protein